MKVAEIIKQLQELDPTGTVEVCTDKGAIHFFNLLPGYWDGPCLYFEPSANFPSKMFVSEKMEQKIVIRTIELEDYFWDVDANTDKIILDVHESSEAGYKRNFDEWRREFEKVNKEQFQEMFVTVLNKLKAGHRVFQTDPRIGVCNVMFWEKDGKVVDKLCQGHCEIVIKSGYFKHRQPVTIKDGDKIYWDFII